LFSKIEVNGDGACDLYKYLTSTLPDEEGKQDIAWNFTKFLVDRQGKAIKRFGPQVTPEEIGEELSQYL
jgi:glutathione peroxidase